MLKSASWGGVCSGGVSALGGSALGRCLLPGGCLLPEGCLLQGGSAPRGVSAPGEYIPACTEADTPPPCGQTDTCENITLAQHEHLCKGRTPDTVVVVNLSIFLTVCKYE